MTALGTIHAGLKQLGIEDDDARDLYERQTGKRSLREMTPREHSAVIEELRRLGFTRVSNGARRRLEGRFAKKLQAQWIAAWNLGLVRDRDDKALLAFVRRQTGIEHVRFLRHPEDARKAIDALNGWMARQAGVVWKAPSGSPAWMARPEYRVIIAQWRLLERALALPRPGLFTGYVREALGCPAFNEMTARDWQKAMNALGKLVRALPDRGG